MKKVPVKPLLSGWDLAPKTPVLSRDEVHVWCAELDQMASRVHNLQQTLDGNERAEVGMRKVGYKIPAPLIRVAVHRWDSNARPCGPESTRT